MIAAWPAPDGEEYALAFDRGREHRLLILPALFDEANKLRHFTVEVMRGLDRAGLDCFLPDLPGCNESLAPLDGQTLVGWREAAGAAAEHHRATHVLTIRGGGLCAPEGWPILLPEVKLQADHIHSFRSDLRDIEPGRAVRQNIYPGRGRRPAAGQGTAGPLG